MTDLESAYRKVGMEHNMARIDYIKRFGYSVIPNNDVTPLTPHIIHLSMRGPSDGSVMAKVVRTNGIEKPKRVTKEYLVLGWACYVGVTDKCSFRKKLPEMIALRDFMNAVHQVKEKKRRVTIELMKSAPTPELKQQLIEAACLAAV